MSQRWDGQLSVFNIKSKTVAPVENLPSFYPEHIRANLKRGFSELHTTPLVSVMSWRQGSLLDHVIYSRKVSSHLRRLEWNLSNHRLAYEASVSWHKTWCTKWNWIPQFFPIFLWSSLCISLTHVHTHFKQKKIRMNWVLELILIKYI